MEKACLLLSPGPPSFPSWHHQCLVPPAIKRLIVSSEPAMSGLWGNTKFQFQSRDWGWFETWAPPLNSEIAGLGDTGNLQVAWGRRSGASTPYSPYPDCCSLSSEPAFCGILSVCCIPWSWSQNLQEQIPGTPRSHLSFRPKLQFYFPPIMMLYAIATFSEFFF